MNQLKLQKLLEAFFIEDIGERDVTTDAIFPQEQQGEIVFLAKDNGVFCGEEIIQAGFQVLNPATEVRMLIHDGDRMEAGQKLATVKGKIRDLLKGERVILNLVQRMSGIATKTREAVETLNSGYTKISDTRKTTPGLRMLEKYAVTVGGGHNHRFGLYDAVLIKDNHIAFAGSIANAVKAVKQSIGHMVKVEVETETKEQMFEALAAGADVIMFDNRKPEEIVEWITHVPETVTTEASGGITLENLASYRECGVDYISLGFLTHSVKALDISVKVSFD
ncbi:nicotinate-nucleotide pyrophosphorylase [Niallia circulans]|uniref:carboxylating nicotinate-nucleotide diphosphorylase n=1 Tax=Niallia circulans TaxID=1397 RepID=UPI00077C7405|nr:carboxylating nicotinate-nucleotide diphosphorylase [Niallia circulans]MCM2980116.1 carboxylating nicotinate-nucleotide diphosphorylase [Niallia circulans]MDR4315262.1 carboxylating nicotinate-nucleotide diphosphorylase [Niallia circulans]MED3840918.1 carboxylating nicotinate-nucleotide diphosphorylase [Niallia circulans]MED4241489.1 carboxylating nicotinate-nucleotide diphosphorylase [Niallia circulans]MED4248149.1 carboxylating nicotinate-nucleotide diphosphorylase [Niallia circulans]